MPSTATLYEYGGARNKSRETSHLGTVPYAGQSCQTTHRIPLSPSLPPPLFPFLPLHTPHPLCCFLPLPIRLACALLFVSLYHRRHCHHHHHHRHYQRRYLCLPLDVVPYPVDLIRQWRALRPIKRISTTLLGTSLISYHTSIENSSFS